MATLGVFSRRASLPTILRHGGSASGTSTSILSQHERVPTHSIDIVLWSVLADMNVRVCVGARVLGLRVRGVMGSMHRACNQKSFHHESRERIAVSDSRRFGRLWYVKSESDCIDTALGRTVAESRHALTSIRVHVYAGHDVCGTQREKKKQR